MRPHHLNIVSLAACGIAAGMAALASAAAAAAIPIKDFTLRRDPEWLYPEPPYQLRQRYKSSGLARGRVGGNQRQRRLDRRRAHAAGQRRAFPK